jgi:hypothetical protein
MYKFLSTVALAAIGFSPMAPTPVQAQGYQIDCAILLCLSGGWPASVPCTRARAEFIRRITPWPVEPPLQIWRCPMSIGYEGPAPTDPMQQFHEIIAPAEARQPYPTGDPFAIVIKAGTPGLRGAIIPTLAVDRRSGGAAMPTGIRLHLAQTVGAGADIDVSDSVFDFIRSIDVFQVELKQYYSGGEDEYCYRSGGVRRGTYDATGQFTWRGASHTELPAAFVGEEGYAADCPSVSVRAVFVDWNDYEGSYGFEQVNY